MEIRIIRAPSLIISNKKIKILQLKRERLYRKEEVTSETIIR
jgi:hypothetical protein